MSRKRFILFIIALLLGAIAFAPAAAVAQEESTVRAVMFWAEGCGHCDRVKDNVLPPLEEQYGDRWQLTLIELHSAADFDRLFNLGAALGVPREQIGVPLLLIGHEVLIGANQIPSELPGLIDHYLAAGGMGWPPAPGLAAFLPEVDVAPAAAVAAEDPAAAVAAAESAAARPGAPAAAAHDGFLLAVVILIGMVLALGLAGVRLRQARQGRVKIEPPAWVQTALPLLVMVGLGVATYLAYVETQAVAAVCGPVGNCNAVQTSEYAYLFGVPVGVLGVLGYTAILAAWAWNRWRGDKPAALALLALSAGGVSFSIYLTYLEPFVIGAVCAWCLTSAVVMTLLLLVSVEVAAPQLRPMPVRRTGG